MERLTLPHYGGKGHYMKCSEQFGCDGLCGNCDELDKLVERLAEYEDKAEHKPVTNADRIRAMSDEELAAWLGEHLDCSACPVGLACVHNNGCPGSLVEWLKQPAE